MIATTEGICGGYARIKGTRIPVWGLVSAARTCTDAQIMEMYPQVTADDLRAAREYYALHKAEIEQQIQENASA